MTPSGTVSNINGIQFLFFPGEVMRLKAVSWGVTVRWKKIPDYIPPSQASSVYA